LGIFALETDAMWTVPTIPDGTQTSYDAIVIGSGVGGSVTASMLAHRGGDRVLVLEKNSSVGGILASYRRAGFKLDAGSHLISRGARGPLGTALRAIGASEPRFLTHPIPVRSRGIFHIAAPAHRRQLLSTALEAVRALRIPWRDAIHLARMMLQVFTLSEGELRRWDGETLDAFVRSHTDHPAAYFLFSFLASIFFVLPPWQVSAGEAIRGLRGVLRDYSLSYVQGGMDRLAQAFLARVVDRGGEVVTGRRAVGLRPTRGGFSVNTDDGREYLARSVACNLAPEDFLGLLDGRWLPPEYVSRIRALRPSGNAHQIKLALSRPLVDEGCLIGGLSLSGITVQDLTIELMEHTVAAIEEGRVSDPLAIYAPVPSNYDPTLAPPGHQLITASVYGPTGDAPQDPPEVWRDAILKSLAMVLPGLEDALLFVEFTPIRQVASWMGKSRRGAICNGQHPGQVGAQRLGVKTPVPGLVLCGDGAGGRGIGTELAATSGMAAAGALLTRAAGERWS